MKIWAILMALAVYVQAVACGAVAYPGGKAGKAQAEVTEASATLQNALFTAEFVRDSKGVRFGGMRSAKGRALLNKGTELFSLTLGDGKTLRAGDMKVGAWSIVDLPANPKAFKGSERVPGKAIRALFKAPDSSFTVEWQAVLRDDSHYLRQELTVKALRDTKFRMLLPLQCVFVDGEQAELSGNTTHGRLVVSKRLFAGLETPMSLMSVGGEVAAQASEWNPRAWKPAAFQDVFSSDVPSSLVQKYGEVETNGPTARYVKMAGGEVDFAAGGKCEISFRYGSGNHKLSILGVTLCDARGKIVSQDVHLGRSGTSLENHVYTIQAPAPGKYTLQYWVDSRESITSSGTVEISLPLAEQAKEASSAASSLVQGAWERKTTLSKGQSWRISSVVGLLAPGQQRRSFLAYSEREKAVPYRIFVHYNDWYEVGIRLHDNDDPLKRTTEKIWLNDIIKHWERELFKKRKTYIDAFVIDDGWDDFNSLWEFHAGFPNGFAGINRAAGKMKAGIGTWLGPVGGYGKSKSLRLAFWNKKHPNNHISSFELSNREYFNAFVDRCRDMIRKYDMRYFKFDGISTKFHAMGPAALEDAEGIINVVSALRRERPDIFINATVGTWASPFWFHFVDSVWRQENDFGQAGKAGDARDKWITYRDRLVYEVFVQGAPLFPINSLMTHGTIITHNGPPNVMSKEPANCIKEIRAAFGSGSGLQEIYADAELLNRENGRLWDELAACIAWIRRNEDVLADTHWVGGNPWNGSDGDVYGWASWNKKKCTLTLRNSSDTPKTLNATPRLIFDIPSALKGTITLRSSFTDQRDLPGIFGVAVDVDKPLNLTLQPQEVIVMEGVNALK